LLAVVHDAIKSEVGHRDQARAEALKRGSAGLRNDYGDAVEISAAEGVDSLKPSPEESAQWREALTIFRRLYAEILDPHGECVRLLDCRLDGLTKAQIVREFKWSDNKYDAVRQKLFRKLEDIMRKGEFFQ